MKTKTTQDIKSKLGVSIAKGEFVTTAFDIKLKDSSEFSKTRFSVTTQDGRRVTTTDITAIGLKKPSLATLEKWSDDGIAKSLFGAKVEPDGIDEQNCPSWLLFLGMI